MFGLRLDDVSGGSAVISSSSSSQSVGLEAGRDRVLVVPVSCTLVTALTSLLFATETASRCFDDRAVQ